MRLRVNVKSVGKRRKSVEEASCEIAGRPGTVRDLILAVVDSQVAEYNQRIEQSQGGEGQCPEVLACLTKEAIEDQAESGKIGFGISYGEKKADLAAARENALQCFEDGIYRIFADGYALDRLDEDIVVTEEKVFTFVRLTMLTGRMW
ncbi:hypothetical protein D3Z51_05080 [Clostridiaceae bacterium]|nr:hypothetical protein [Clostridiaceae bacterium]RKI15582.1 hypothetical protein D7V81_06070 [bacterium 1XD21-70]